MSRGLGDVKSTSYKLLLFSFFVLLTSSTFSHCTYASTTESFVVPPLSSYTLTGNLFTGDILHFHVSVISGTNNGIDLQVSDPAGNIVVSDSIISEYEYTFVAGLWGSYTFKFDNSFSIFSSKTVTFTYETITNVILIGTIIILIAIIISVFLIYRRHHKPPQQTTEPIRTLN